MLQFPAQRQTKQTSDNPPLSYIARRAVVVLALLGFCVCAPAQATLHLGADADTYSLGPHVAYLEDPAGALTVEQVASLPTERFTAFRGSNPSFGFTASAYWLRFSLDRDRSDTRRWFLQVGYPLLDSIELYAPSIQPGRFERRIAGDHLPFRERQLLDPNFYLELPLTGTQSRTFYLRIQSQSSLTAPLHVLTERAADGARALDRLVLGLFYGALLALAIYNLLIFIATREMSYLYYVAFVVAAGLAQFTYNGFSYQFLWPDAVAWNDRAPNVLGLLALALGIQFTRSVLATRRTIPRADVALTAITLASVAFSALSLGPISYAWAVRAFSILAPAGAAAMLVAGILCLTRGDRAARFFMIAWSLLLLALTVHSLRIIGVAPTNLLTVHAIQIGSALEMLLLSFALADRINTMKREKEAAQALVLEAARRSERDLEAKVEKRVGELAALNRALEAEVVERRKAETLLTRIAHHDPLTGLPNRLLLLDRFNIAAASARRNEKGLAILLLDLDGFKQVNDTFGHDVGDRLLIATGEALRNCIRESDTVSRLGGDEFVVLLTNLRDPAQEATLVAQKILERLGAPTLAGEHYLVVTASIGVALYPVDGADLEVLLKCADRAMYQAKQEGGRTVRFAAREVGQQYQLGLQ